MTTTEKLNTSTNVEQSVEVTATKKVKKPKVEIVVSQEDIKSLIESTSDERVVELLKLVYEYNELNQQIKDSRESLVKIRDDENRMTNEIIELAEGKPCYIGVSDDPVYHFKLVEGTKQKYNKAEKKQMPTKTLKVVLASL